MLVLKFYIIIILVNFVGQPGTPGLPGNYLIIFKKYYDNIFLNFKYNTIHIYK